ncbi:MarR family transcriptional regulator [Carbonactinospora thermoautotrophica]|uniref:Transcriptional regulator n=1 Tax=Carbonactinospora thermoautotrophica TaxID=1469144 RepID=A0A132MYF3_9ACTN|nr:MarR family transcriptional regulator [Carbonactinospora thermoautotrophica]KWX02853.1 Transcriptional regulator [Carbonactinospora thermoautotrophica]MCX9192716.1 MarR family transcriptional regulator [Carbonactinospora thermoautotrophica]
MRDESEQSRDLAVRFQPRLRELVLLLRRASAGQPITAQQYGLLGSLEAGPRRMTELAEEQGVQLPTMTVQVNRLEKAGLVARSRDPHDARVVAVELTPAGRRQLEATRQARIDFLARRFATLTPEERAAIEAALPALDRLTAGTPDRT